MPMWDSYITGSTDKMVQNLKIKTSEIQQLLFNEIFQVSNQGQRR